MTETEGETVADVLCSENGNCRTMQWYVRADDPDHRELGYEDVFYPLRCHHDRLAWRFRNDYGTQVFLKWGAGDFIYRIVIEPDGTKHDHGRADPFTDWQYIQHHGGEPVLRADTPFAEGE